MKAIVAVNRNWGIGYKNKLLYRIPEDMKFFRSMTTDKVIVVGRKTLMTFPGAKPLKNRTNIVLTRDNDFEAEGAVVCRSIQELMTELKKYNTDDVFVVGGAEIYGLLLPYCSTVYITKIDDDRPADKFFADLDKLYEWKMTDCSETHEYEGLEYKFCTYTDITHM